MTIKDIIEKTTQHFKQKGFATARLDAETLFGFALNMKRVELYLHFEKPLAETELEKCREVVRRRTAGEPVAYIIGARDFYKSTFAVGPGVLIPRPETELLVEAVVDWIKKNHPEGNIKILDLGAGSGCISLSLAKEFPSSQVIAVEKSEKAAHYFNINKDRLEVLNANLLVSEVDKVNLAPNSFDVIVANPPYISENDPQTEAFVKKFEPHIALFSSENGMSHIRQWISSGAKSLKSKSAIGFEIGLQQASSALALFSNQNIFSKQYSLKDYSGHDRFVCGEKD